MERRYCSLQVLQVTIDVIVKCDCHLNWIKKYLVRSFLRVSVGVSRDSSTGAERASLPVSGTTHSTVNLHGAEWKQAEPAIICWGCL